MKTLMDIRSLARAHTASALKVLQVVMQDSDQPGSVRVAAATALLDRGWGKPKETIEAVVKNVDPDSLSDAVLAGIIAGRGDDDGEAPRASEQLN